MGGALPFCVRNKARAKLAFEDWEVNRALSASSVVFVREQSCRERERDGAFCAPALTRKSRALRAKASAALRCALPQERHDVRKDCFLSRHHTNKGKLKETFPPLYPPRIRSAFRYNDT